MIGIASGMHRIAVTVRQELFFFSFQDLCASSYEHTRSHKPFESHKEKYRLLSEMHVFLCSVLRGGLYNWHGMMWVQANLEVIAQSDNRGLAAGSSSQGQAKGWAGCREHCHAFPESGSGLHSVVKASSYCTVPLFLSNLFPYLLL